MRKFVKMRKFVPVLLLAVFLVPTTAIAAEPDLLDPIEGDVFGETNHVRSQGRLEFYDAVDARKSGDSTYDFAIKVDENRIPQGYNIYLVGINGDWSCNLEGQLNGDGMAVFEDVEVDQGVHGFTVVFRGNTSSDKIWAQVEPSLHTWAYGTEEVKYVIHRTQDGLYGGPLALMKYQEDCPDC